MMKFKLYASFSKKELLQLHELAGEESIQEYVEKIIRAHIVVAQESLQDEKKKLLATFEPDDILGGKVFDDEN